MRIFNEKESNTVTHFYLGSLEVRLVNHVSPNKKISLYGIVLMQYFSVVTNCKDQSNFAC